MQQMQVRRSYQGRQCGTVVLIKSDEAMYFAKGLLWHDQDSRPTASTYLGMDYIHRYDHFYGVYYGLVNLIIIAILRLYLL